MKILDGKTWLAAMLVLLAGLSAPATADARTKYSIKAEDWLFTEADKARVDDLARQAASRWNVIGDAGTSRKFKEASELYFAHVGGLDNVSGRLDIWKPGNLVTAKEGRDKREVSFIRQTEFRERDTTIGSVSFYETRNLRCLKAQDDRSCSDVALEVGHYATTNMGVIPPFVQVSTSLTCNATGKAGVSSWKGHSALKCKAMSEKRPTVINQSSDDGMAPERPRIDNSDDLVIYQGEIAMENRGEYLAFVYLLTGVSARLEGETRLLPIKGEAVNVNYNYLYAKQGKNLGTEPKFVIHEGESTIQLQTPSGWGLKSMDFLCDKEWDTCVKDHAVGWEEQPDGRLRLDIDGCKNDICFKGYIYGNYVPPKLNGLSTSAAVAEAK